MCRAACDRSPQEIYSVCSRGKVTFCVGNSNLDDDLFSIVQHLIRQYNFFLCDFSRYCFVVQVVVLLVIILLVVPLYK